MKKNKFKAFLLKVLLTFEMQQFNSVHDITSCK